MALEDILNLIKQEAESKAKDIISKARAKASEIEDTAKEEAESEEKKLLNFYENKAQKEKQRIIDNTKLEIKKNILREKRKLLNLLYKETINRFKNMDKDTYLSLIRKLILENTITKNETLVLSKNDKFIDSNFIKEFNKQNKGYNLSISDDKGNFTGGFLLKTSKQQVDCSFEALISLIKEEYEVELSNIYFSQDNSK